MRRDPPLAKPRQLAPEFGAQFGDRSVVAAYAKRPPYPEAVFDALAELAGPGTAVLDLGAGSGDITWLLARRVGSVDAVEPSHEMIATAIARNAGDSEPLDNVRWFECTAEEFSPERRYSLVVAGESLHWMEWSSVLPKVAGALDPDRVLAIVAGRVLVGLPWQDALLTIVKQYSTNPYYQVFDIGTELSSRGLFRELGRRDCLERGFSQSVSDYVESFHSRNGFSRERMSADAVTRFDAEVSALVLGHCPEGFISATVKSTLIWGLPVAD